jgi:small conductance mechanosensitive channel
MRIVAKTAPMRQWEVARELRARVKAALDAAGVSPAGPDTIVITAPSGQSSGEHAAAVVQAQPEPPADPEDAGLPADVTVSPDELAAADSEEGEEPGTP